MTILKSDTFSVGSDTALETYDTDWSGGDSTAFTVYNATPDRARLELSFFAIAALGISPSSANYSMLVTGQLDSTGATYRLGPAVRHNGAAKGSQDCYYYFIRGSGTYQFGYFSAGSQNSVTDTTITAVSFSTGTLYDVQLKVGESSSDSYECLMGVSGGALTTETSGTNSAITAAGDPGFYMQGTVSSFITAYSAEDFSTGGNSNLLLMGVG